MEWQTQLLEEGNINSAVKSATWGPAVQEHATEGSLIRCVSLPNLMSRWACSHCQVFNNSVTSHCVACGLYSMAAETQLPITDGSWMKMDKDQDCMCAENSTSEIPNGIKNVNEFVETECKSCEESVQNRSPKRQSPSVYERVKSKVSRSLSNGGVIHRRWVESKGRPNSLIVDSNAVRWNMNNPGDKPSWSCQRCTLVNSNNVERCDVCEMPRKANIPGSCNTLPRTGVVITVPDWGDSPVGVQNEFPTTPLKSVGLIDEQIEPNSLNLWSKPIYRRSYSEVLPGDLHLDNKINRRSLIETDAQGNLEPPRQVNNLNLQLTPINRLPSLTRYSYIGISEPPVLTRTPQGLLPGKRVPTPPIIVELAEKKQPLIEVIGVKTGGSFERMWTCIKCSFAYNPIWSDACDICTSVRTPPSLTEPSLITVTKDSVRYTPPKTEGSEGVENEPLNHLQQDLEDDFQFLPGETPEMDWTCKKCTLVNSGAAMACVVCGGSKLRSITLVRDMTLRKGEFWTCSQCTLKNPLTLQNCKVCKTANKPKLLEVPVKQVVPRSPSPRHGQKTRSSVPNPALGAIPKQKPTRRNGAQNNLRNTPQVRHGRSGIIGNYTNGPVTNELSVIPAQVGSRSPSSSWHCIHCTFENRTTSPACEMCHSSRNLTSVSPIPPGTPTPSPVPPETPPVASNTVRQESELMEDLRHIEEREALEKWKRIVHYCKEV